MFNNLDIALMYLCGLIELRVHASEIFKILIGIV